MAQKFHCEVIGISSVQETNLVGHRLMMRERAEAVGGTLRVISNSGMSTRVEANLPIQTEGKKETKDSVQE